MGSHVGVVERWFGVSGSPEHEARSPKQIRSPKFEAAIEGPGWGEVVYVTGASGAGKSTLLREMKQNCSKSNQLVVDVGRVKVEWRRATVDTLGVGLEESLRILAGVGLAEARAYVRAARTLSEGERWRLKLGVALARVTGREAVLFADEFAAVLDRVTAMAVSHSLRRATRWPGMERVGVVVATSHSDLREALGADRVVRCDFGVITNE